MFTDIDRWATILWIALFLTAIWGFRSDPRNRVHTRVLIATAPAILIFMAVYANARQDDAWCLGWAVAGIVVAGLLAAVSLARLTAHYVIDQMQTKEQD